VTNLCQYNARNQLTNLVWGKAGNPLATFAYKLGPTGNRTALTEAVNNVNRGCNWSYDPLYRLTNETLLGGVSGSVDYAFDAVGNRTNRISSLAGVTNQAFGYTVNDWLSNDVYDANGNTRTNGANVYQYDADNRLTNAIINGTNISYIYNGDGVCVRKSVNGATTLYLVDALNPSGYAQVLEEKTVSGTTTNLSKVYIYGLALISQRDTAGNTYYFGTDGQGSTRFLANISGNIVNKFTYDSYGNLIAADHTSETAFLYTGQQWDGDLGMYYLRARYYKTETGRFWTMDSYEGASSDPLSLHKYLYCHANPITLYDPNGMFSSQQGYQAESAIMEIYVRDHPEAVGHIYGGTRLYDSLTSYLKPDIQNDYSKTYLEIKPLSTSGIVKGEAKILLDASVYTWMGYSPEPGWKPSSPFITVGSQQMLIFNCAGVVFYTDAVDNAEDLLGALTFQALKDVIKRNPQILRTLVGGALERIPVLVAARGTADTARMQQMVGIASLITLIAL
jgi:RHS repeat-associated protein